MASQTVASWNQVIDWFKEVAELRELGLAWKFHTQSEGRARFLLKWLA